MLKHIILIGIFLPSGITFFLKSAYKTLVLDTDMLHFMDIKKNEKTTKVEKVSHVNETDGWGYSDWGGLP